jgi:hypothetical protein
VKRLSYAACFSAFALCAATPFTPGYYMNLAQSHWGVPEKTGFLKQLLTDFPLSDQSRLAHDHLVALLAGSNRFEEALKEYQVTHPGLSNDPITDFKLMDYQLKTGRFSEVLRETQIIGGPGSLSHDLKVLALRVQAYLAQGQFEVARQEVERWLALYQAEGVPGSLYESDIKSMIFLKRHLRALERLDGNVGKPLFTASVADSLNQWSHQRDVPIYFFKLIPARSGGEGPTLLQAGRYDAEGYFKNQVEELNRGFDYLSSGQFSLHYQEVQTLYVRSGDVDPENSGGNLLTSRVYVHTLPQLYRLAGKAFVVLVDYRQNATDEAAYMGDGILHVSANKMQTLTLMHEILHGLGATHQDWNYLERQGYKFDPEDRGLMTFENGELNYLGLESKNRALLGWPAVAVVRLSNNTELAVASAPTETVIASAR